MLLNTALLNSLFNRSGVPQTATDELASRMAKYNQLLRIEEELGASAIYGYKKVYKK